VTATFTGESFSSEYAIAQNEAHDWFRVSPQGGTLESGRQVTFNVTLPREKKTLTLRTLFLPAMLPAAVPGADEIGA
jgi:hypothetical protein